MPVIPTEEEQQGRGRVPPYEPSWWSWRSYILGVFASAIVDVILEVLR